MPREEPLSETAPKVTPEEQREQLEREAIERQEGLDRVRKEKKRLGWVSVEEQEKREAEAQRAIEAGGKEWQRYIDDLKTEANARKEHGTARGIISKTQSRPSRQYKKKRDTKRHRKKRDTKRHRKKRDTKQHVSRKKHKSRQRHRKHYKGLAKGVDEEGTPPSSAVKRFVRKSRKLPKHMMKELNTIMGSKLWAARKAQQKGEGKWVDIYG